ncbi:MAG: pyridoxal phosphate-dependent aminotransferase [bacterium]
MRTAGQRTAEDLAEQSAAERSGSPAAAGVAAIRPEVRAIRAYRLPAPEGAARLHQNEAPGDWPEAIKREVAERLVALPWHHYPSAVRGDAVAEAIGGMQGTPAAMVAPTAGSNEALRAVFAATASGGVVVMPTPTFSLTKTLAMATGARVVEVPLGRDFALDPDAVLSAAHAHRAAAVYLASPNNPTANLFDRGAIIAVLDGAPGAVVIDEAYWEFTRESHLETVHRYGHLLLTRTFSKAMAGAGLRIGWITAQAPLIAEIAKISPPYSLNLAAQVAAPILIAHRDVAVGRVRTVVAERGRVASALQRLGLRVYPSETNFILFDSGGRPHDVWQRLAERGVLIRDVSSAPQLQACLRVSVGSPEDNDRFLAAIAAIATDGHQGARAAPGAGS